MNDVEEGIRQRITGEEQRTDTKTRENREDKKKHRMWSSKINKYVLGKIVHIFPVYLWNTFSSAFLFSCLLLLLVVVTWFWPRGVMAFWTFGHWKCYDDVLKAFSELKRIIMTTFGKSSTWNTKFTDDTQLAHVKTKANAEKYSVFFSFSQIKWEIDEKLKYSRRTASRPP